MFGLSKSFVIFLFIGFIVGWGTHNPWNGLAIVGVYAIVKIILNILT